MLLTCITSFLKIINRLLCVTAGSRLCGRMEVSMSYVAPAIKEKFETLSVDLKNTILERDVKLYTIHDLINVLDDIVKEAENEDN